MIFVDTGAWIAFSDQRDQYHEQAGRIYTKLKLLREKFITNISEILIDIQDFLEVSLQNIENDIKQNDNRPLREMILNFEELKHHFNKTQFEIFFD